MRSIPATSIFAATAFGCLLALQGTGCAPGEPEPPAPDVTAAAEQSSSWLRVSESHYDFGEIPHGLVREKAFTIKNTGTGRVRLNGIRSQCTCAVLEKRVMRDGKPIEVEIHDPPILDKGSFKMLELDAGDVLELTVRVDTTLRSPLDHHEPSYSELVFEPVEAGTIRITYEFTIRARLEILTEVDRKGSPAVNFGTFGKHQKGFGVLELAPRDGKTFVIREIEGLGDRIKLEKKPPVREGGHRWLVELEPNGEAGYFMQYVTFHTDLDEGYACPIRFEGVAVPNLQIMPNARLDFGRFDVSQERRRTADLIYRRPDLDPKFRMTKLFVEAEGKSIADHFEVSIDPLERGTWRVALSYRGGLDVRRFEGQVELTSDDPEYERIVLPFTGYDSGASKPIR